MPQAIYFARNAIRFLFGGDGEELTLDGGSSPLNGRGVVVDGNNVTFPHAPVYNKYCSPPGNCRDIGAPACFRPTHNWEYTPLPLCVYTIILGSKCPYQ